MSWLRPLVASFQSPNSISDQSTWNSWWTRRNWCRFLSEYWNLPLLVSFYQCSIIIHSSITDANLSKWQLTAYNTQKYKAMFTALSNAIENITDNSVFISSNTIRFDGIWTYLQGLLFNAEDYWKNKTMTLTIQFYNSTEHSPWKASRSTANKKIPAF